MLVKIITAIGIAGCLFCGDVCAADADKLHELERVNFITGRLLAVAQQRQKLGKNGKESFDDSAIRNLVRTESSISILYRLAAVSRSYGHPGKAEDHVVDDVFFATWTLCVSRIEEIGGAAAIKALEDIPRDYQTDGDASLEIQEALDRLRSRK